MKLRPLISTLGMAIALVVTIGLVKQRQILQKKAAPLITNTTLSYIHQDQLGSTALVTDANGSVVSRKAYYPYGSIKSSEGQSPTERGYTGQVSDTDQTGLLYYNARYYDPTIAKFTQADTVNDSLNRYSYVDNNPITKTDPTGHCTQGAGDYEECLRLVAEIEEKYPNIHIITNSKGYEDLNYQGWTAHEVAILGQVLDNHPFIDYIDQNLAIVRSSFLELPPDAEGTILGVTRTVTVFYADGSTSKIFQIGISNTAWDETFSPGLGFFGRLYPAEKWQSFASVITHELTHSAYLFHPELLDYWISASGNKFKTHNLLLGTFYTWSVYDKDNPDYDLIVQGELFAMATEGLMYNSWWGQSNLTDPYLSLNHLKTPLGRDGGGGAGGKPYLSY